MVSLPACPTNGVVGVAVYWFEWSLLLIPCGFAFYGIYLATLLANAYWISVVGAGPLVCTAISVVFSLAYAVIHALQQFSIIPSAKQLLKVISLAAAVVSLVTFAVLLTFFTPTEFERNRIDFNEYTLRNYNTNTQAKYYYDLNATAEGPHQILTVITDRSITPKLPLVSFFITWITAFSCYFFGANLQHDVIPKEHPEGQSLLPSHASDEEEDQQAEPSEPKPAERRPPQPKQEPQPAQHQSDLGQPDYSDYYSDYMASQA